MDSRSDPVSPGPSVPYQTESAANPVSAERETGADSPQHATDFSTPAGRASEPRSSAVGSASARKTWWNRSITLYAILATVVAVVLVLAAFVATGDLRRTSGSSPTILVTKGTRDLIPFGEFDTVVIDAKAASEVNGTVVILFALIVYTMTTQQFTSYVKTANVSVDGYTWSSGLIQNDTSGHNLDIQVVAGFTYLVFANPLPIQTLVGFSTNLILEASG